jgi:La domain
MESDAGLRTQIEYYLSDKNLEKDAFFYDKIQNDQDGYLDLDLIMNCNKVKSLNTTKDAIAAAVKASAEVEVSADGSRIRRKENKALPEPKFSSKKMKTDAGESGKISLN